MKALIAVLGVALLFSACDKDMMPMSLQEVEFDPQPYEFDLPDHFPQMIIPADNPMTVDGVALGRRLFYDPILSADNSLSCAGCHMPEANFTDNLAVSPGIDGISGVRSSMSLLNVGFNNNGFFWDGRVLTLEEQALLPVEDPIELHNTWTDVVADLRVDDLYPVLFRRAFGITSSSEITKELAARAIAQFERSLVSSGRSKYDRVISGEDVFTDEELLGHNIFFDIEPDINRHAECGHCHNAPLFTTNEFFNNGLDDTDGDLVDIGLQEVTGRVFDAGKFRVPSLRNIELSAPFMHDGRLETLDEVRDHYDGGVIFARNVDPNLRVLDMSDDDRRALVAFIRTLEDPEFTSDERYSSPF